MATIVFRELSRSDLPTLNAWRHARPLVDSLGTPYRFIGEEVDQQWFDHYLRNRDHAVRLCIFDTDANRHIGNVQLSEIDHVNRSGQFGIFIAEVDYQSQGIGTFATRHMVSHGFRDLNLHRIWLSVLKDNSRAIRTYERIGFRHEGLMREALFKNGQYCDVVQMSLLSQEFDHSMETLTNSSADL
jgi:RimJ/RimL family protein N-acetyltransferase